MRRKTKSLSGRPTARTGAAGLAARRTAAAWIDAEQGLAFTVVTPRVRDGLPLRRLGSRKTSRPRSASDARGAR